ncbi:efflux RND transporter periplasmic adaptor subunit [Paenibacillus sp. TRM 82003]|nr:efflux RND transporter periplasmic adaptor subunit [Paenibacillus sp. TRM 82003]
MQPTQESFDVVEAGRGNIETFLRGTANFVSAETETLSFKEMSGRLKSINVKVGQPIKAGDLLAELETGELDLQIRLQRLTVEREGLLYREARTSGADGTNLRLREIDLEREQLSLDAMEGRLERSRLYSPIDGIVTFAASMDTGDFVNAFQLIVTVADPSSMHLTYVAAESKEVLAIEPGMPVALKYKGKSYTGNILQAPSNAPPAADDASAERDAVTIVMSIDNPPDDVQVGHSAELAISLQKRENVIVLPRSAVRSYMGRSYVQIAEDDRRKEIDIEVGLTTPTEVEIVKGLEEGQFVILNH